MPQDQSRPFLLHYKVYLNRISFIKRSIAAMPGALSREEVCCAVQQKKRIGGIQLGKARARTGRAFIRTAVNPATQRVQAV